MEHRLQLLCGVIDRRTHRERIIYGVYQGRLWIRAFSTTDIEQITSDIDLDFRWLIRNEQNRALVWTLEGCFQIAFAFGPFETTLVSIIIIIGCFMFHATDGVTELMSVKGQFKL